MLKYIICYVLLVNMIAFLMYGMDKKKAKKGEYRISERALLTVAAIGGSIGAMVGMKVFRHKTKHKKFVIGVPLFLFLHCILMIGVWLVK